MHIYYEIHCPYSAAMYNQMSIPHVIIYTNILRTISSLLWRQNERDGVSNHQSYDCLLNRLFIRRSKKLSKLRATGFGREIHRWPVNSPHKGPTTRKIFPFDDVIMITQRLLQALKWKQSGHWLTHLCQKHVTFLLQDRCATYARLLSHRNTKKRSLNGNYRVPLNAATG